MLPPAKAKNQPTVRLPVMCHNEIAVKKSATAFVIAIRPGWATAGLKLYFQKSSSRPMERPEAYSNKVRTLISSTTAAQALAILHRFLPTANNPTLESSRHKAVFTNMDTPPSRKVTRIGCPIIQPTITMVVIVAMATADHFDHGCGTGCSF